MAPIVSDHAVVRFLQRAFGFEQETVADFWRAGVDVDDVRSMIFSIVQQGVDTGAEGVTWKNLRFMLRGQIVTTVLTRDQFYSRHISLILRERQKRKQLEGTAA